MAGMNWQRLLLSEPAPPGAWAAILEGLAKAATERPLHELEQTCIEGDTLLADAAWDLWRSYAEDPACADLRTAAALKRWWDNPGPSGRAVLILDAMSLRELPALLSGADVHSAKPLLVRASGAPVPTNTAAFASALGLPSRSKLKGNGAPTSFVLSATRTDVYEQVPFADLVGAVGNTPDVFLWHDLVDAQLHLNPTHTQLFDNVTAQLKGAEFWQLVAKLRQGRRVVVTSDHGYALRSSSRDLTSENAKNVMRTALGGSRSTSADEPLPVPMWPSLVMTTNKHHVVVGNRKWKVPGVNADAFHGGLSLLEIAVPWVEFAAL